MCLFDRKAFPSAVGIPLARAMKYQSESADFAGGKIAVGDKKSIVLKFGDEYRADESVKRMRDVHHRGHI
jgi:hypothetical protein